MADHLSFDTVDERNLFFGFPTRTGSWQIEWEELLLIVLSDFVVIVEWSRLSHSIFEKGSAALDIARLEACGALVFVRLGSLQKAVVDGVLPVDLLNQIDQLQAEF